MSIVSGKFVYYYMARENLCFLTLAEESYPKRMAFMYLEEIADAVLKELIQEFGNDVSCTCIKLLFLRAQAFI